MTTIINKDKLRTIGEVREFPIGGWDRKERRTIEWVYPVDGQAMGEDGRYIRLYAMHSPERKVFFCSVNDEVREDRDSGMACSRSSPMESIQIAREPVARYSKKALREFFDSVMNLDETVDAILYKIANPSDLH
jgi:hypothetical protein